MSTAQVSRTFSEVGVGGCVPRMEYNVTATTVVQGAAASRDWQPQHHDAAWARRVGTDDIFLNTPTQGGWMSRYLTDWLGPSARIGRFEFRMRRSIYPGHRLAFDATVTDRFRDELGGSWLAFAVTLSVEGDVKTSARVLVSVPFDATDRSPWARNGNLWVVPPFPEVAAVSTGGR